MPGGPHVGRPTFLLLHGLGLSHRSFTRAAKLLVEHGDVVAVDLPGFGGTPRPSRALSVEDAAQGIALALDRTGVLAGAGPVVAVGHSMGAQFAVELALRRPDLVSGVVMVGPVVDPTKRTLWQQALALARDAALEPPRTNLMVQRDYLHCGPVWFFAETRAMLAYPTHERLRLLAQPLLVVSGARDPIADAEWAARAMQLAGSALPAGPGGPATVDVSRSGAAPGPVSIPGHRHNVVHSSPAVTAGIIARFVDTLHD